MAPLGPVFVALTALSSFLPCIQAQGSTPTVYKDPDSGIIFDTWTVDEAQTSGNFTFGITLPPNALSVDASEFMGYLKCSTPTGNSTGWCGVSLGGGMANSLLLVAWPNNGNVLTSFRFATGYAEPDLYTGNAKLTQLSSTITSTHFTLIFRCQNCLAWKQGGSSGKASTSKSQLVLGWAQAKPSPGNPTCPDKISVKEHDNGQGIWGAALDSSAVNPSYASWAAKATKTVTATCEAQTSTIVSSVPVATDTTWDYVVVGAGAGGIPLADRLSEAGKRVLLVEKGPPSSGRWGSTMRPSWLNGTNLTRFDVPGLCNEIWHDASGIACTDTDEMAGCVLGGGTAVNAGLWFKPNPLDWDDNFPTGWKSADMAAATERVFSRIPGTDTPSLDGNMYLQEGFHVLSHGLKSAGWTRVNSNHMPEAKNHSFAKAPFMFSHGERGGPMATYLVSAKSRSNFALWTNTAVKRVVRKGGHVTGIEVEAFGQGGHAGIVSLTPQTGRAVLSAGTFGSAKILMRSGIGPADQLAVVQNSTDGPTMIDKKSWIQLPVGYNLDDHTNTDTVIEHPNVVFYDFYAAFDKPNVTDMNMYLDKRSGILAQAAPNLGPIFWDEIKGADGIVRQLQWTARVEGSLGVSNGKSMTLSQYLGRGSVSRGRMTITPALNTVVSTAPYLRDPNDKAAVVQGIKNLQAALKHVDGLTWASPNATTSAEDYVENTPISPHVRGSNHWLGTAKMGLDDGRVAGQTAVVDANTRVYGTDNLFVVDASIFPGMTTTNPSALIVVASEHAAERILALSPAASVDGNE